MWSFVMLNDIVATMIDQNASKSYIFSWQKYFQTLAFSSIMFSAIDEISPSVQANGDIVIFCYVYHKKNGYLRYVIWTIW